MQRTRKAKKIRKSELISPYFTIDRTLSPKTHHDTTQSPSSSHVLRSKLASPKARLEPISRMPPKKPRHFVSPRAQPNDSVPKMSQTTSSRSLIRNMRTNRMKETVESYAGTSNFSFNSSSASALHGSLRRDPSSSRRLIKARQFPMNSVAALKIFKGDLTEFEQREILEYKEVYFLSSLQFKRQANASLPNSGFDDERSDYLLATGDQLDYRYEVLELLGKGSFGQVVSCIDHKLKSKLAVKVIRNKTRFHKQALIEAKILDVLKQEDPESKKHIVRMNSYFLFRNHLCITFELLSINLYDLIKLNQFNGFSTGLIRRFAVQILEALEFVKSHAIIHCDLKPENILLCDTKRSEIKLIDFGSGCFDSQTVYTYIQSRFYRSPEIILGIPYTSAIDMWSFGCIIMEFCTGMPIFPGENEGEQLQIHMQLLGIPPPHVILRGTRSNLFFDRSLQPILTPAGQKGKVRLPGSKNLTDILQDPELCDLISKCLEWDPKKRITPTDALNHSWLSAQKSLAIE